jgi:hypothetical protein
MSRRHTLCVIGPGRESSAIVAIAAAIDSHRYRYRRGFTGAVA